jgi:DNA ligase (NAD+)
MTTQNAQATDEYTRTVASLQAAANAYENTDTLLMSDTEFDTKLAWLADYEDAHGITPEHTLHTAVAAGASAGGEVTHPERMGSLDKPGAEAVLKFAEENPDALIEPKIDGGAIRGVYRGGKFVQAVRRGDGNSGDDVTARIGFNVEGLPATIINAFPGQTQDFEVRGEIYLSEANLEKANAIRAAAGKGPFANLRNGISGMVNKQDGTYDGLLSFAAYGTDFAPEADHLVAMDALSKMGFTTAYSLLPQSVVDKKNIAEAIEQLEAERLTLGFDIDGAVVKVATAAQRKALGEGSRAPKWAVAHKYPPLEAATTVEKIELNIGKTGRLSLRAWLTPVKVDGSMVDRVSLHNVGWLQKADIRVGDTVMLMKRGDVIPYIQAPLLELRPEDSTPWIAPASCHQCGEGFDKSTELWRCLSPECSVVGRIVWAVSRDCLDIDGFGISLAEALVEADLAKNVADLFHLTEDQYATLSMGENKSGTPLTYGRVKASKIMAELEKAKAQPWNRVLCSLALRMTGRTMSRRLAAAFPTAEAIRAASATQLANVEGVGQVKANAIHFGLQQNAEVLDRLAAAGVNMGAEPEAATDGAGAVLAGEVVVVTGSVKSAPALATLARNDMNELIEAHGGKSSGSVSAKTTLLVCGEPGSSKWTKATELGIEILTPVDFAKKLGLRP